MASSLSAALNGLQQQHLLLNEVVARFAALPQPNQRSWTAVRNKLQELYSDFTGHIAILQLLLSCSTEGGHALAELDGFPDVLQSSEDIFKSLRAPATLSALSKYTNKAISSANTTSFHFADSLMPALEHAGTSVRAAMASLFLSFTRGAETISPAHSPSDSESPTLQEAFSLRPFALTGTDISLLVPHLDNKDLTTVVEDISTQVNTLAKKWVQRQKATTCGVEPYVLSHFWLGNTGPMKDTRGLPISPKTGDKSRIIDIPFENWLKRFTSTRNTAAFVGSGGCGKSAMINAIVGVYLITPSIPTSVPCRIRHNPSVSEPTLEVAIEPYHVALELLRKYGFTQQCSRWQADRVSRSIGCSDAPESFRNAWDAWAFVTGEVAEMITEFERPDFQLTSKATGLKNVNKMLGYLDAIAFYCINFGLAFDPFCHEWPVINLTFNPSPDPSHIPELINLPGYTMETLTEKDMPYLGRLLQEGVTIVPVISIEEHFGEGENITEKLPELLIHRDSPIPCVIGTYFDAIRNGDPEALDSKSVVASLFWDDRRRSSDVIFCSPIESVTATFVLHYLNTKGSVPSYEEAFENDQDLRYWGLRELSTDKNPATRKARYLKFTKQDIQRLMLELQDDSGVTPATAAYYRASTAPMFRDEAAAAFRRRLGGSLKDTLSSIDAVLIKLGNGGPRESPDVTSTTSVQELSSRRLSNLRGVIRNRASEEITLILRNAFAEVCRSRRKADFSEEEQDDDLLLLTAQSLRGILQHCQKAAELPLTELRTLLAHDLVHHGSTETTTDLNTSVANIISHLPTSSASLSIESLSSFKVSDLRVLVLHPFYERSFPTQRPPSLWRKTGLVITAFVRALFGLPAVLVRRRQGYYRLSLAQIRDRFTSEVIAPWLEEMGRVAEGLLMERVDVNHEGVSLKTLDPETRHQLRSLVALRCNLSAVLAVLV